MLEKMKAVSNPLTIIALFAALAEVAGTVSLKFLTPELQAIFIWFVMGFPVLLVGLFFYVLIMNPKVLYGPSDYREDATYLSVLSSEKQSLSLDVIQKSLDEAVAKINEEAKKIETTGATARDQLVEIVNQRLLPVQNVVEEAREDDLAQRVVVQRALEVEARKRANEPASRTQFNKVIEVSTIDTILRKAKKPLTIQEIEQRTNEIPMSRIKYYLENLIQMALSKF